MCACVRACVRACVCACVRACVLVCRCLGNLSEDERGLAYVNVGCKWRFLERLTVVFLANHRGCSTTLVSGDPQTSILTMGSS